MNPGGTNQTRVDYGMSGTTTRFNITNAANGDRYVLRGSSEHWRIRLHNWLTWATNVARLIMFIGAAIFIWKAVLLWT